MKTPGAFLLAIAFNRISKPEDSAFFLPTGSTYRTRRSRSWMVCFFRDRESALNTTGSAVPERPGNMPPTPIFRNPFRIDWPLVGERLQELRIVPAA